MLVHCIILLITIIVIVGYPLLYKKCEEKGIKKEKDGRKRNYLQREIIIHQTINRINKMMKVLVNHIRIKRAIFNRGNPLILDDYSIGISESNSYYDSITNTVFLELWDTKKNYIRCDEELIKDMISCFCTILSEDSNTSMIDNRKDFIESAIELHYITSSIK